jgi:hypothetical protein
MLARVGLLGWLVLISVPGVRAQSARRPPDSVTVVPGEGYPAGWLRSWLAGQGYRKLWGVPMRTEVANLALLGGGLSPLKAGGGMTTRTLHMEGGDGHRYVFRSVDKYVGQGLPEELQHTVIESALQDQISAFHPTGAPVVAALLEAIGVLHTSPRFMVLPDDPRLGEFRHFAGTLVLFEARPDSGWMGARQVISTPDLYEKLDSNPRHRVAAGEYLAIRLVDLWVGDRDRSVNNSDWGEFGTRAAPVWRPIPRDRDQAFINLDGAIKKLVRTHEPRLVRYGEGEPEVVGLTRNAWDVDRRVLTGLEKPAWDSVTANVLARISDSVIDAAVRRLPPEHFQAAGATLAAALKARRRYIASASGQLYRLVAEYADIHATDLSDHAEVTRLDDGKVFVRLYPGGPDGTARDSLPSFQRAFHPEETREVRLYLKGHADRAVVSGAARSPITVRIIGGEGADTLADSSTGASRTLLYDGGDGTGFESAGHARVIRRHAEPRRLWGENAALPPDWGHRTFPAASLAYSGDLGIVAGAGVMIERYGFLKSPYKSRQSLSAAYSMGTGLPMVQYRHEMREVIPRRADVTLEARWSGIDILHFHGFGNETERQGSRAFHRVQQRRLSLAPSVVVNVGRAMTVTFGPLFATSVTDTSSDAETFLSSNRPYGSGTFSQLGGRAAIEIDTRDRGTASGSGLHVTASGSHYPGVLESTRSGFGAVDASVTTYLSATKEGNQTAALRLGGRKVFGAAPFYEAAFIGGYGTVRGFRAERFAGTASAYANLELRFNVTRMKLLVPADVGVFGLLDAGRVFQPGEQSGLWHTAAGGGLWVAPVRRSTVFSLAFARSAEGPTIYLGSGFMY